MTTDSRIIAIGATVFFFSSLVFYLRGESILRLDSIRVINWQGILRFYFFSFRR